MNVLHRSFVGGFFVVLIALLLAAQNGCRSDKSKTQKALPKIVMVAGSVRPDYDIELNRAIKENQQQNQSRYEVEFEIPAKDNAIDDQIKILEKLISENVQAILIVPTDSKKIVSTLKKAVEQEIVVVNLGDKLDEETLRSNGVEIPRVGFDKTLGAIELAKELANLKLDSKEVAIFAGSSAEDGPVRQAYEKSIGEAGWQIVMSEEFESGPETEMTEDADERARKLFEDHPNLSAILCSDAALAVAAAQAVSKSQRTSKTAVMGIGNADAGKEMLQNGVTVAAVMHDERIGVHAVDLALKLHLGGSAQEDVSVPLELEKGESYAKFAKESESLE